MYNNNFVSFYFLELSQRAGFFCYFVILKYSVAILDVILRKDRMLCEYKIDLMTRRL